jgi:cytochrome c-type biogenesis protein CcmH/NrfG
MMSDRRRIYAAITVAAIAIAVTATGLYVQISRRVASGTSSGEAAVAVPSPAPGAPTSPSARPPAPAIEVSAERLAQRLKEKGGTGEDWALLARSYVQMQRYPDAVDAFAQALEMMPGNAAFLAEQSAARKAVAEGTVTR